MIKWVHKCASARQACTFAKVCCQPSHDILSPVVVAADASSLSQAVYCSAACAEAAGSTGSTTGSSSQQQHSCVGEHAAGGLECGRPWTRLLPEQAVLASRCLRASQASAAAGGGDGGSGGGGEQTPPQQWQQLCQLQHQLHLQAVRATLLDSLAAVSHTISSSNASPRQQRHSQQQQQQQEEDLEQLAIASVVSHIHQHQHSPAGQTLAGAAAPASKLAKSRLSAAAAAVTFGAVRTCLQQLDCNGIAVKPFLSSGPEDRRGLGLYPVVAAVVNHNCDPNCSIRWAGS